jgi:hypothetical protein
MYAAAEVMVPGLRPQDLAVVARAAADVAAAMLERSPTRAAGAVMTPEERAGLAAVVEGNAEQFRVHLAQRTTAEAWESFDVPWDYRKTLDAVVSGRYAADLLGEALWVAETLAALFADTPPRTVRQARIVGLRELALRNGPGLLVR